MKIDVSTSIQFRDVIMSMTRNEQVAYVRIKDSKGTVYRVIPPVDAFSCIELVDLFESNYPPVTMEAVASAMAHAEQLGQKVPVIEICTLGEL